MNAPVEQNLTQQARWNTASISLPNRPKVGNPPTQRPLLTGIVDYEMLAGRTPFAGENAVAIAYKQVHDTHLH